MDVTIIIATYGSDDWLRTGNQTAEIAMKLFDVPVVRIHSDRTLAQTRNCGANIADTEWLCFLDGGDELSADYFEMMDKVEGDLRAPELLFREGLGHPYKPFDLTVRNIDFGNPCAIGTLIRKEMFLSVGGFWEEPAYEDWSLFRRAWLKGAQISHTKAKYTSYVLPNSRNVVSNPSELISSIRKSHERWVNDNAISND